MAIKVLEGRSPESIPFGGENAYIYAYDWRELKRWAIPETAVPVGSEMHFRLPSFWEAHRLAIMGAVALIVVQSFLIVVFFINFFKRRKAEQSLMDSEECLNLAMASSGAGLWSLELTSKPYWVTDRTKELYGLPLDEEVTYDRFLETVHPEDRELVHQEIERMVQSKEDGGAEFRVIGKDRDVRWIAAQGHIHLTESGIPDRILGVSIDITNRKLMEEELRNRLKENEDLKRQLEKENVYLRDEVDLSFPRDTVIGKSTPILEVLEAAERVARTDSTVLITGETGVGKELLARFIHNQSNRRDRMMVKVNCGALPPTLIESELFGREKGAYTGALSRESGRFEMADGSTLFLDEIGELQADVQSKLLRFLESGEFERLGSSKTLRVDVRVVAATNRNLTEEVKKGAFREDLYYRLNVFPIEVPPLRQRSEDIPLFVQVFIKEFNKQMGKTVQSVSKKSMDLLCQYTWPGNIRELRNVIEHAVILSQGETLRLEMPKNLIEHSVNQASLEDTERQAILRALKQTGWQIKGDNGAAEILNLKPSTLYSKMKKLGIPNRRKKVGISPQG
jgi:formate hydrogenlyase transcriptional activator